MILLAVVQFAIGVVLLAAFVRCCADWGKEKEAREKAEARIGGVRADLRSLLEEVEVALPDIDRLYLKAEERELKPLLRDASGPGSRDDIAFRQRANRAADQWRREHQAIGYSRGRLRMIAESTRRRLNAEEEERA